MAEYNNKKDVLKEVVRFSTEEGSSTVCSKLYADISNMPTIDIVHCKDCKHIDRTICLTSFPEKYGCKLGNGAHRLDFFCSDGEVE